MENLINTTTRPTDTEILLTNLRINKWDYKTYRSKYGENALNLLKGITPDILDQMRQNYDFSQDVKKDTQPVYTA